MDDRMFDDIARLLAGPRRLGIPRRAILGGLLGLLGAGHGRLARDAAAACKKPGQKCAKSKECCDGAQCQGKKCACKQEAKTCGKVCCPPDRVCACDKPPDIPGVPFPDPNDLCRCRCLPGFYEDKNGKCVCDNPCGRDDCCDPKVGEACCSVGGDKLCVLTNSSENHCGRCGNRCDAEVGETCCDGKCVDLQTDADHCGHCGGVCPGWSSTCVDGVCRPKTCQPIHDVCRPDDEYAGFCSETLYCVCFTEVDGEGRCGHALDPDNPCRYCASSADCVDEWGPDLFCADKGTACERCAGALPGFCVRSCPYAYEERA